MTTTKATNIIAVQITIQVDVQTWADEYGVAATASAVRADIGQMLLGMTYLNVCPVPLLIENVT
jgi:hypothetical protein